MEYLKKNELPNYAAVSETYQFNGKRFLLHLIRHQDPPEEFKKIGDLLAAAPSLSRAIPRPKITFSTNTMIRPTDGHFFIERDEVISVNDLIDTEGGFILIHGARSSST